MARDGEQELLLKKEPFTMVKITHYAEELLQGLDELKLWPEKVKTMQKNWIGKSTGAEIQFQVKENDQLLIFTTRPDTIYGASLLLFQSIIPWSIALGEEEIKEIKEEFSQNDDEKIKLGIPLNLHCRPPIR